MHCISHCEYKVEKGMFLLMMKLQGSQGNGWAQTKSGKTVRAVMESNKGIAKEVPGRSVHGERDSKCDRTPGGDVLEGSLQGESQSKEKGLDLQGQ